MKICQWANTWFCVSLLLVVTIGRALAAEPAAPASNGLDWKLPYSAAEKESKATGKPMLVFVGDPKACSECREFLKTVCMDPVFIAFAKDNLLCTQLIWDSNDPKEEKSTKGHAFEMFNIPASHAVIIANPEGKRIGELSTKPVSIGQFIKDIQTFIAKSVPEGRLKYTEVDLLDKEFTPSKTYKTEPPKFSPEPLKGRYINFLTAVRVHAWENTRARTHGTWMERNKHTPAIARKMRKALAEGFPGARITWGWSWGALNDMSPDYVELRKLMREFHKEYGDEMTYWPGVYFADKFNTVEQAKKDLHEGLGLITQMVGDGYRPKSVLAGHMSVEGMKYLAKYEGIHTVQGQIWSQFDVDGQDGDGGIIYPYYPSKDHFLKPAQDTRGGDDFVDVVNIDGWTVDFFAARKRGTGNDYNSRVGIGPIETYNYYGKEMGLRQMLYTSDVHFNEKTVADNGYGFLTVNWELSLFEWIDPQYLVRWLTAIRTKYPDTQMLSMGEFGDLWRKHNPDNSRINLKFVQRGHDMPKEHEGRKVTQHPPIFRPEMEIRWYFNKDFRFATIQNWKESGPKLVMDYTRYNQPYKEPSGNVIERHWDILDVINQKESRPQDKYKPFAELPVEEQAKILNIYPELNDLKQ